MIGRKALFPGRDYLHQLRLIIDVLGNPSEEVRKPLIYIYIYIYIYIIHAHDPCFPVYPCFSQM